MGLKSRLFSHHVVVGPSLITKIRDSWPVGWDYDGLDIMLKDDGSYGRFVMSGSVREQARQTERSVCQVKHITMDIV